jgi:hypothetical protein
MIQMIREGYYLIGLFILTCSFSSLYSHKEAFAESKPFYYKNGPGVLRVSCDWITRKEYFLFGKTIKETQVGYEFLSTSPGDITSVDMTTSVASLPVTNLNASKLGNQRPTPVIFGTAASATSIFPGILYQHGSAQGTITQVYSYVDLTTARVVTSVLVFGSKNSPASVKCS